MIIGASIRKDSQLLLRDRGALASLFVLPIIFIAVFGSLFGGEDEPTRQHIGLVSEDSARSQRVRAALIDSMMFDVTDYASSKDARAAIAGGQIVTAMILPEDFDPFQGRPGSIVFDVGLAAQLRGPLEGALTAIVTQAVLPPLPGNRALVALIPSLAGGQGSEVLRPSGFQVAVPGNSVLFGFFLALTVALSFGEERRHGTWRRLLAAPIRHSDVLLAKLVPFVLIGLVQMLFLFGTGALVFGLVVEGSLIALILLTMAQVLCATSLGLFIASFGGSEKQVGGVGSICLLVMGLVGGAMVPRMMMPGAMQSVGLATPHAWALDGFFDVLVRPGTGVIDIVPQLAALAGFTLLFGVIGTLRFRFEP